MIKHLLLAAAVSAAIASPAQAAQKVPVPACASATSEPVMGSDLGKRITSERAATLESSCLAGLSEAESKQVLADLRRTARLESSYYKGVEIGRKGAAELDSGLKPKKSTLAIFSVLFFGSIIGLLTLNFKLMRR